jgi:hypothetical protein
VIVQDCSQPELFPGRSIPILPSIPFPQSDQGTEMKNHCLTNLLHLRRRPLLLIVLFLLSGCSDFGVSVGDYPTEQLLLNAEAFPPGWDVTEPPQPLGPSNVGYGDEEDDRSLGFTFDLGDEPAHAYQEIMQFRTVGKAERWYERARIGSFNAVFKDPLGLSEDGNVQLRYDGVLAGHDNNLYGLGCTVLRGTRPRRCAFSARYDQFIVEFNSVIDPEAMTIEQFNAIVAEIDRIMVDNLDLSVEQNE